MSTPSRPEPVKLVLSILAGEKTHLEGSIIDVSEHFGRPDFISALMTFHYTDYYSGEMGSPLIRRLLTFEKLREPETLPEIKLITNTIEDTCKTKGKRTVNIDPGYLSRAHFILATGKGYAHRPYLGRGIYADLTLIYRQGAYQRLEWTYPDYAGSEMLSLMNRLRGKYILQLEHLKKEQS